MKTIFLFPCEYDNLYVVDDNFQLEYNACQSVGLETALFDHDLFISENKLVTTLKNTDDIQIILRGWMLNKKQYFSLYENLDSKLINNPYQYLHCHYFPNVMQDIKEFIVPVNCWFYINNMDDNLIETIQENITSDILIKDFVKSEKGTDVFILDKDYIKSNLKTVIERFIDLRGNLFNEGIVLKEIVKLKKYDGVSNEWRAFFYDGELISLTLNSEQAIKSNRPEINFVKKVSYNITKSRFFTIDFAELEDGSWKVLECGDGQVSGLASMQNELVYYSILKEKI